MSQTILIQLLFMAPAAIAMLVTYLKTYVLHKGKDKDRQDLRPFTISCIYAIAFVFGVMLELLLASVQIVFAYYLLIASVFFIYWLVKALRGDK